MMKDDERITMEREEVLLKRKEFFEDIVKIMFRDLGRLDYTFGQDKYYVKPQEEGLLIDSDNGELLIPVSGEFFGQKFEFLYSVWQVGVILKIGVLIRADEVIEAIAKDDECELLDAWIGYKPIIKSLHGGIFIDWVFDASEIYNSYLKRESYSMGVRHMHLRALKTIYDYFEKKSIPEERFVLNKTKNNEDSIVSFADIE